MYQCDIDIEIERECVCVVSHTAVVAVVGVELVVGCQNAGGLRESQTQ